GPVRAADHAATALPAAGAVWALAAEERVGDGDAGLAEVHPDGGLFISVADTHLLAQLAQKLVGGIVVRVLHDAEHPLRLGVVRSKRRLPVVHVRPLAVLEDRLRWHVQRVCVSKAAPADAA